MDNNRNPMQVQIDGRIYTGEVPQDILQALAEQHCDQRTSDLAIKQMGQRLVAKGLQPDIPKAQVCYGPSLDEFLLGGATLPEMVCQESPTIWWQESLDRDLHGWWMSVAPTVCIQMKPKSCEVCHFELENGETSPCQYCDED